MLYHKLSYASYEESKRESNIFLRVWCASESCRAVLS